MKKVMLILASFCIVCLTSCSKDDDPIAQETVQANVKQNWTITVTTKITTSGGGIPSQTETSVNTVDVDNMTEAEIKVKIEEYKVKETVTLMGITMTTESTVTYKVRK